MTIADNMVKQHNWIRFLNVARGEEGGHFRGHWGPGQRLRNRARNGTRPEGRECRLKTLALKLSLFGDNYSFP